MLKNNKLLIAIDNAYACMDHIYDQLIFLNNNNYNISIFFIYDFGREQAYLKIKEVSAVFPFYL